jgi:hypothetical protein
MHSCITLGTRACYGGSGTQGAHACMHLLFLARVPKNHAFNHFYIIYFNISCMKDCDFNNVFNV